MHRARLVSPALVLLLAACASAPRPGPLDAELERVASLLVGDFRSSRDGGAHEGRPLFLRVRRVEPPAGRRIALYAETRHDGAGGELYRQRLYLFDETPGRSVNSMQVLTFEDPAAATRLVDEPGLLRDGIVVARAFLGAGCDMVWQAEGGAFTGRIDPATCEITGKRGDRRRIESVMRISAEAIGQLERGYGMDGALLFGNPTDELHIWPRLR